MSTFSQLISDIKKVDDNLGTGVAKDILLKLSESMSFAASNLQKQISSIVGTMKPDFKREVIELITKFNTGDNDEKMAAFDKVKKLQEKFNLDLLNFSKIFGINIDELNKTLESFNKMEEERKQIVIEERQLFREKMIPTKTVDGNVMPLTKREQLREIYDIQKQIYDLEKERKSLMAQFEKNEIDKEKFKVDIKKITDREKVLNERKSGVMYDDPNRPRTLREKFVGAAQGAGEFLRGERGPELIRGPMGAMYGAVSSPIDASRQILQTVDTLTFGISGAITKSLGNLLTPSFKGLSNILRTGFGSLGTIFADKFKMFGTLILRGLLFLATALGLSGIKNMLTSALGVGATAALATTATGATAGTAAGTAAGVVKTAGGIGLMKSIGLMLAPFAGVGALAYLNRPRNEEDEEFMKSNSEITSKETSSSEDLQGYMEGRKEAIAAGESRMARNEPFMSLDDSMKKFKNEQNKIQTDKPKLSTPNLPTGGDFNKMSQEFATSEMNGKNYSPITNNVAPTNINSNTVQNINQTVDVINKEPTINLINSQGYGYTVV
jgi:hypothetical protein